MNKNLLVCHVVSLILAVIALSGCSDGNDGAPGAPGSATASLNSATALNIAITRVTINSAPVVNFKVTNQDSVAVPGLTLADLRFTIAKLMPGANGATSAWQNYINTTSRGISGTTGTYIRGNRENNGTLVDNGDGTYVYTFHTDITDPTQTCPSSPCIDADGNTLDTRYNPNLTTRVAIQTVTSNREIPMVNGIYTFRPSDGATTGLTSREIVATSKCNVCHNKLEAHDERIETRYCVVCHNPGSTARGQVGTVVGPTTVDFKVMIHKLHHGESLPSVIAGGDYGIYGFSGSLESFKDVVFPQDIRNCTKCHDATTTAQGDNWETQPSTAVCSACHDDVYFGNSPDPAKPYQVTSHIDLAAAKGVTVGPDPSDDMCIQCHGAGQVAPIAEVHAIPSKLARGKFKFNLLKICGVSVASNGTANTAAVTACQPGGFPTVTFSVTDPTGGTHGYPNSTYSVFTDPEFAAATSTPTTPVAGSGVSLTIDMAWNTLDYTNTDGSQARPARANQFSVFGGTVSAPYGQASGYTQVHATDNGDGTYTLTAATPIPATATGSGAVALEGRAYNSVTDPAKSGTSANRIPIKAEVAYFGITDTTPKARRVVVDASTKCDNCHDQLSLHGGNRNDNVQLCAMCHNPNNTDAQASARPKASNGLPIGDNPTALASLMLTAPADGKAEESIDLKRMIHGIHAGAEKSLDGSTSLHGFREKGIFIAGADYSDTRFPGILNDCSTCHVGSTYQLTGDWEAPLQNSILGATTDSATSVTYDTSTSAEVNTALNDPTDDLKITPTAAVCSSCHDGATARVHMTSLGGAVFDGDAAAISASYETCSVCHKPGATADVQEVHGVP